MLDDDRVYVWNSSLRQTFQRRLDAFNSRTASEPTGELAAVAFVIVPSTDGSQAGFLLTKRSATLRKHSGQWAFPGGRCDPGESPETTALRELEEEVGIRLNRQSVLGLLDEFPTRSGFSITPVVVWGSGEASSLASNSDEVASTHWIPLEAINRSGVPRFITDEGGNRLLQMPVAGSLIHAPTGAIMFQAREVLLRGKPTRVAHFEQPRFAWR